MDYKAFFEDILKKHNYYIQQKADKISIDHLDKIVSAVKVETDNNPKINKVSVNVGECDGGCNSSPYKIAYVEIFKNLPNKIRLNRSTILRSECYNSKNPGALGLYNLYTKKECVNYEELVYDLTW